MISAIFIYNRKAGCRKEILETLRSFDNIDDVREIKRNREIISNFIPNALIRGAESWLIFFQPNNQRELLILPFPDENDFQRFKDPPYFRSVLSDLIPCLIEGFRRLKTDDVFDSVPWIRRLQYIRLDSDLNSLLDEVLDGHRSQSRGQIIRETLQKTNQDVQEIRREKLHETLTTGNQTLLNELDEAFATENDNLFRLLQNMWGPIEVRPPIVDTFGKIMDSETKKFLLSSETVREFIEVSSPHNFDYSIPGCGFWKAVELELNLSLVLYLRRENGIASDNPRIGNQNKQPVEYPVASGKKSRKVNINLRGESDKFKSIMLGDMCSMLKRGHRSNIHQKLKRMLKPTVMLDLLPYLLGRSDPDSGFKPNSLPTHLEELIKLRNRHAHISAMSHEDFNVLRNLVLPSDDNQETCLVKILQLKSEVLKEDNFVNVFHDIN